MDGVLPQAQKGREPLGGSTHICKPGSGLSGLLIERYKHT